MKRSKWVVLRTDKTVKAVADLLRRNAYSEESGYGFELLTRPDLDVRARYVEKLVERESVRDPFGTEREIETIRYCTVNFGVHSLTGDDLLVEVMSPPRSLRTLIAGLDAAVDGITLGTLQIDLLDFFGQLRAVSDAKRTRITRLRASNLALSTVSLARIEIVSSVDALREFKAAFSAFGGVMERICIENLFGLRNSAAEISRSGLMQFDDDIEDELRAAVINYFRAN